MDDSIKENNPGSISRRAFLKGSAAFGGLLMIDPRQLLKPPKETLPSSNLPKDILPQDELDKAHITIYQTEKTKLYFRKGIFDFPLFHDAREGKINGVVVSLIDSENLSWNRINDLPEDARTAWQTICPNPRQYTDAEWDDLKLMYGDQVNMSESSLFLNEQELEKVQLELRSGESTDQTDLLERQKKLRSSINKDRKVLDNLKPFIKDFSDREKRIDYYNENIGPQGRFINAVDLPDETATAFPPNIKNKVYIYLAVGGMFEPDPSQSFPQPNQFTVQNRSSMKYYDVYSDSPLPGFTSRHEFSHYDSPDKGGKNEYFADHGAYDSIVNAAKQYKETGNTNGYPIVFVNQNGITITQLLPFTPQHSSI